MTTHATTFSQIPTHFFFKEKGITNWNAYCVHYKNGKVLSSLSEVPFAVLTYNCGVRVDDNLYITAHMLC
jgi:hypothetical protein